MDKIEQKWKKEELSNKKEENNDTTQDDKEKIDSFEMKDSDNKSSTDKKIKKKRKPKDENLKPKGKNQPQQKDKFGEMKKGTHVPTILHDSQDNPRVQVHHCRHRSEKKTKDLTETLETVGRFKFFYFSLYFCVPLSFQIKGFFFFFFFFFFLFYRSQVFKST